MGTREVYSNGILVGTESIPDPPAPALMPVDIVLLFTPAELLALEQSTSLIVVAFRTQFFAAINPIALDDPRFTAALQSMQTLGILSADRVAAIQSNTRPA
ncbi:hypothetical protein EKK58_12260 [Candidatus Dependentiae bacterium]|nr:MAG: hypothetical protein EKK58_12260 [Candidatus Dependentiae bacterium]